jgi:hypothetical protein
VTFSFLHSPFSQNHNTGGTVIGTLLRLYCFPRQRGKNRACPKIWTGFVLYFRKKKRGRHK